MAQESQQYPQYAPPSPSNGLAAGFVVAASDEGDTPRAARPRESETSPRTHPVWCHFDRPGLLGGVEHIFGLLEWHPSYLPDAAVLGWLRHVFYPDGGEETRGRAVDRQPRPAG